MMVDSKSILNGIIILGLTLLGVVMAVSLATNTRGGLVALIPMITVIIGGLAFVAPRIGLFGLAALVIWVDEFKRLAVYFGGAYSVTVIQTLAMPFVVLAALNAGFLLNLMFGKVKLDVIGILIYVFSLLVGGIIFFTMDAGWAERGQRAASLAGYMTLIPIVCAYFRSFDDWRKFIAFQALMALPAAAWAIKQYFYGFDHIEWMYARSGLSKVHYTQMFGTNNPRVFGFFGSASGLGCAAIYCAFAVWHAFRHQKRRFGWLLVGAVYLAALIVSTQRTALLYPLIVILPAFAFRTRLRTTVLYATGIIGFIVAVGFSDYLLRDGLDKVNNAIAVESGWGSEVLRVSTFSDRLRGWTRLKRADSWSLFGTGEEVFSETSIGFDVNSADYNHDIINKILIRFGVVGLLGVAIPLFFVLRAIHGTVFRLPNKQERRDAAFSIALSLPVIALSFVGGDNFTTNPINLQIWTCFAGVLVFRSQRLSRIYPSTPNANPAADHPATHSPGRFDSPVT